MTAGPEITWNSVFTLQLSARWTDETPEDTWEISVEDTKVSGKRCLVVVSRTVMVVDSYEVTVRSGVVSSGLPDDWVIEEDPLSEAVGIISPALWERALIVSAAVSGVAGGAQAARRFPNPKFDLSALNPG